jgi:DNA-binding CsgD family transcriptional regulator
MRQDGELAARTARAVDRLGTGDFYDALLAILGAHAAHDLAALVCYSRVGPPDLIIPRIEPTETMMAYYDHYHAFDPFFAHWKNGGEAGVFRLRAMDTGIGRSAYAREFLTTMNIHDEIAVFLPPIGDASPTLILDRAKGNFLAREVAQVRSIFPLLAALHRRHLSIFVTAGVDPGNSPIGPERPLRFVDARGVQVFATAAWEDRATDPEVAAHLAIVTARGPCTMPLSGQMALRRTQLPPDFGPAPGGLCDEIAPIKPSGQPSPTVGDLPPAMAGRLSEREREVVLLTLRGYPVIEIARRMGLSRGTVKNYRLAIYRKLDITTERELFGEFMAASRKA